MRLISCFRLLAICGVFFLALTTSNIAASTTSSPLPEDFKFAITMKPAITKIIEEDDVEKALIILNKMHSNMAEDGWELYQLMEFIDDEDFEGFFVTYKKQK